jgi:hypothetical protein
MLISGLIVGVISFFLSVGSGLLLSPVCMPCCMAGFLGVGAGFLTGVIDKPGDKNSLAKRGAIAGAIGSIGALIGQVIASVVNGAVVGPQGAGELIGKLGLPMAGNFESSYWLSLVGGTLCFVVWDVILMAGLGAIGGLLWWQFVGQKRSMVVTGEVV